MDKVLSVVIPTLNRCEYLKRTFELLLPQIERNKNKVELVVCCNASKDGTDEYMESLLKQYDYIVYKYFNNYVEVGESLIRSFHNATGKYCVLWGDDDLPFPYLIDYLLDVISSNPNVSIIHLNRLHGKDTVYGMKGVQTQDEVFKQEYEVMPVSDLINRFTISLGFISSLVFKRDIWDDSQLDASKGFYGYEHLPFILCGAKNGSALYCNLPMLIQRNPMKRDFSTKWPLYHFIGVPNMMRYFDGIGLTESAYNSWDRNHNSSFPSFVWDMAYTSLDRRMYKPLCKEMNKSQKSRLRKFLTYVLVYTFPKSLFKMIKAHLYKN